MSKKPEILALNKIKPPERKVKLQDKEINTSKIPSTVTLEIIENYEKLSKDDPESFDILFNLVLKIINSQNDEEITKQWLLNNTHFEQLYKLIEFIMDPIQEKVKKEAVRQGKN